MTSQQDVKVFISWSGGLAKAVAVALRGWLPVLSDRFIPWASDIDIAAGQRGLAQIESELTGSQFGVVVVTAANQGAPWLNFEAGALSKAVPNADLEQRVVPFLVDLSGPSQLTGPLGQFQARAADREGTLSVLRSLGELAGIDPAVLEARFDAHWHALETKIESAKVSAAAEEGPAQPERPQSEILDEILIHVRQLRTQADAAGPRADPPTWGNLGRLLEGVEQAQRSKIVLAAARSGFNVESVASGWNGALRIVVSHPDPETVADAEVLRFADAVASATGRGLDEVIVSVE